MLSLCFLPAKMDMEKKNSLMKVLKNIGVPMEKHLITLFKRLVCLKEIHISIDYYHYESYTPNRISLKAGF